MSDSRERAKADFKRMVVWIAVAGVLMVVGALWYLSLRGPLSLHLVIATVAGVFFSVLLGCGLFAAAFFSDKSGHDQDVTDATSGKRRD
jgi:hypothetical protein